LGVGAEHRGDRLSDLIDIGDGLLLGREPSYFQRA
jgi:hypothetical protein